MSPSSVDYGQPAVNRVMNAETSKKLYEPSPLMSAIGSSAPNALMNAETSKKFKTPSPVMSAGQLFGAVRTGRYSDSSRCTP